MSNKVEHKHTKASIEQEITFDKQSEFLNKLSAKVNFSLSVLHFLSTHPTMRRKHKYTKAEAYYDLCYRQYMTAVTGEPQFMTGGIQELANSWSWARDSVSRFITHLVKSQVAITLNISTSVVVILTNIEGLPDLPENLRPKNNNQSSDKLFLDDSERTNAQNSSLPASYTSEVPEASHDPTVA